MKFIAKIAIITDIERRERTEAVAFNEAVRKVRKEYEDLCKCHPVGVGTDFTVQLMVEFVPEDGSR
jgi:hypothetical protein